MTGRLLVVEDDRTIRGALEDAFTEEGYDVTVAADGRAATDILFSRHFDLVVLDVMLPYRGGLEILRDLREHGLTVPVLLLTVRGDENDKVLGLDLGADDYVTKPFSLRELSSRVRALLRRPGAARAAGNPDGKESRFALGDAEVDLAAFEIRRAGEVKKVSAREAAILTLLRRNRNRVVTRDRFLEEVWGDDLSVSERTIDTHVLNLRQKIERDPKNPRFLVTVHGVGYRLIEEGGGS